MIKLLIKKKQLKFETILYESESRYILKSMDIYDKIILYLDRYIRSKSKDCEI